MEGRRIDWLGLADIDLPIDIGWALVRVSPDRTTITRICKGCAVAVTTPFDPLTGKAAEGVVQHAPFCRVFERLGNDPLRS